MNLPCEDHTECEKSDAQENHRFAVTYRPSEHSGILHIELIEYLPYGAIKRTEPFRRFFLQT